MNSSLEHYLAAQIDRNTDLEDLIKRLFARIESQQILLQSAVHELSATDARPKGTSRERFVNDWYRRHHVDIEMTP